MMILVFCLAWSVDLLELGWPVGFRLEGPKLWVLDHSGHRLWVLNWIGEREPRAIGEPGQGPGELWFPDVFWRYHGEIAIFSRATQSISFFLEGGTFLRRDAVRFEGYPMGLVGEQLLTLGGPAGPSFEPDRHLVRFWDVSRDRLAPLLLPSTSYRQVRGALQDFFFAWGPEDSFFYADPFEMEQIYWVYPHAKRTTTLPIANPELIAWDGKSRDLPEAYGLNTCWSHDRFHAPQPGFYFEFKGTPFLVATWIRGNGLAESSYLFQVWDVAARVPVQWSEKPYFPIGLTFRESILCWGEDANGYFLLEIPLQAFLAGSWEEGEAAVSRLGL